MPIYEYRCEDCASSFETFIRPGHQEDAACPSCQGVRLSRELSVFSSAGGAAGGMATPFNSNGGGMRGGCCGGGCGCG